MVDISNEQVANLRLRFRLPISIVLLSQKRTEHHR